MAFFCIDWRGSEEGDDLVEIYSVTTWKAADEEGWMTIALKRWRAFSYYGTGDLAALVMVMWANYSGWPMVIIIHVVRRPCIWL